MDWQTNWLIDWKIDWQIDWLTDWLTDRLNDWCIDWLTHSLTHLMIAWLILFVDLKLRSTQQCPAIDYTRHTLDGAASLLNSNKYFPSRYCHFFLPLIIMLVHQWNKRELFNLFLHRLSLIFGALFLLHAASAKLTTVSKLVRKLLFIFLSWHVSLLFLLFYSPITNVQRALFTDLLCCWLGGTVA